MYNHQLRRPHPFYKRTHRYVMDCLVNMNCRNGTAELSGVLVFLAILAIVHTFFGRDGSILNEPNTHDQFISKNASNIYVEHGGGTAASQPPSPTMIVDVNDTKKQLECEIKHISSYLFEQPIVQKELNSTYSNEVLTDVKNMLSNVTFFSAHICGCSCTYYGECMFWVSSLHLNEIKNNGVDDCLNASVIQNDASFAGKTGSIESTLVISNKLMDTAVETPYARIIVAIKIVRQVVQLALDNYKVQSSLSTKFTFVSSYWTNEIYTKYLTNEKIDESDFLPIYLRAHVDIAMDTLRTCIDRIKLIHKGADSTQIAMLFGEDNSTKNSADVPIFLNMNCCKSFVLASHIYCLPTSCSDEFDV